MGWLIHGWWCNYYMALSRLFRDNFREWNPSITGLTLLKCMAGRLKPRVASSCFALAPLICGIR